MRVDQKKGRPIGERGFTLLEVIVAISILTFGLLAVASMQMTAIRGNYNASNITEATTVAQDRLEDLMGLLYSDPLLDPGNGLSDPAPPSPSGYTITYDVLDNNPITNTRLITVTVQWQDKGVQKQTVLTCVKPQVL
jgi:type IV pilus assembly protein PilV